MASDDRAEYDRGTLRVEVSEHAREKYQLRADTLHLLPRLEDAWRQAHEIPSGDWLDGERARYDPPRGASFPFATARFGTPSTRRARNRRFRQP